jgi:hypothetical protein
VNLEKLYELEHTIAELRDQANETSRRVRELKIELELARDYARIASRNLAVAEASAEAQFPLGRRSVR